MTNNKDIFLLTIQGAVKPAVLEDARNLHNETAGNPQGVAAARSLGDLSHNVFVPLTDAATATSELLFIDTWNSLEGLGRFFSDPQVQAGGGLMFKTRDPVVWTAANTYSFSLPSPHNRHDRFVGMIRGAVRSRDEALSVFDKATRTQLNASRMLGHVSHHMFLRVTQPGEPESLELLGIDIWHDGDGMNEYYEKGSPAEIYEVFSGEPAATVWKQPAGLWVEW